MKKLLLLLVMSVALVSCKDDNDKKLTKPQSLTGESLPDWMTPRIDEINNSELREYFYIVKAEYLGEKVYLFSGCCPTCLMAFIVYREDGSTIKGAEPAFVTNSTIVWKPEDFSCNVQ